MADSDEGIGLILIEALFNVFLGNYWAYIRELLLKIDLALIEVLNFEDFAVEEGSNLESCPNSFELFWLSDSLRVGWSQAIWVGLTLRPTKLRALIVIDF